MNDTTIDRIEAWACVLPLPAPIDLGRFQVRQRQHLAVRIHTAGGLTGECITQSRGSPLDMVVRDLLGPLLIGRNSLDLYARKSEVTAALTAVEFDGAIGRAWSALEICLQDIRAQVAGWPLWRLLGGNPRRLPVQLVEGYALVGESDEAFVDRLQQRVDEGYVQLKIEAGHYTTSEELCRRLALFRKRVGDAPRLILDMAWSWRDAKSKLACIERVREFGIAWIEDPFPRSSIEEYGRLRDQAACPVGAGDEASRPAEIRALMEARALDVVRLDASTLGGIEAARSLAEEAERRGLSVSFHEHPEIHEHCAFGQNACDHVEVFPTDRPFDRVHDMIQASSFQRIREGHLSASSEPGLGMRLRQDALERFATRYSDLGSAS